MKNIIITIAIVLAFAGHSQNENKNKNNLPDSEFATEAAQAGMLEVKLGELAVSKSASQDVRELGRHMVTDHTKANNELKVLAAKKNLTLPENLDKAGQKSYDQLSGKSGTDFDKAYTKMMVKDHKKVIAAFKKEAEKGMDSELKTWASKTLPTLQHHLSMSEGADQKVNNGSSADAKK